MRYSFISGGGLLGLAVALSGMRPVALALAREFGCMDDGCDLVTENADLGSGMGEELRELDQKEGPQIIVLDAVAERFGKQGCCSIELADEVLPVCYRCRGERAHGWRFSREDRVFIVRHPRGVPGGHPSSRGHVACECRCDEHSVA